MSANNTNPPAGNSLPPIPDDVLRDAEQRLRQRKPRRDETKRKIQDKDFKNIDKPERLRARVERVLGDPAAADEAMRATGSEPLESLGAGGEVPELLLERIIGGENFIGVRFFDLGKRAARSIVRVDIRTPDGRSGSGTGSLVSKRLLLTNNHVLKNADWARRSSVVFDFEDDSDNNPRPTVAFRLDPNAFFFTDEKYDFTLVAVQETSLRPIGVSLSSYGFNPLDPSEGKVAVGEPINIIQHPSGLVKQVVLQENRLLDLPEDPPGWLHYESDTLPGSSGAPLFNNRWEMVGLHHAGWPKRDANGRILTVNGTLWTSDMGELAIKWLGNEGARVSQILTIVEAARNGMDAPRQALVTELLSPPKSGTVVVPTASAGGTDENTEGGLSTGTTAGHAAQQSPSVAGMTAGTAGVTITLPLNITVSLGAPVTSAPSTHNAPPPPATPPNTTPLPGQGDITRAEPPDTERADSLRELAEAAARPYFNAQEDEEKREEYYREVDLDNSDPDRLFDSLSQLLAGTHVNRLNYKPARHLYPWVDLHSDGKLHSLYTTDVYEPRQLIEEAFKIESYFEAELESLLLADGGEGALPLLEAGPAFNCEHVVPRSWFRGPSFGVAEGDLHHLFTCHSGCNSFRGNVPFWDFDEVEEAVMTGCGRSEENRFEPARGKGAAARAVLYFLLRYPGLIDDIVSELQNVRLKILLSWHNNDPVSEYERHRNAAIHDKQGNRNPLIDFPDLAGGINFARGLA